MHFLDGVGGLVLLEDGEVVESLQIGPVDSDRCFIRVVLHSGKDFFINHPKSYACKFNFAGYAFLSTNKY